MSQLELPLVENESETEIEQDGLSPTVDTLLKEAQRAIDTGNYDCLVFAGEGEPTLRPRALLALAKHLGSKNDIPMRLVTNGIIQNDNMAELLHSSGISSVSVALMTHDPVQYDNIMMPNLGSASNQQPRAHEIVCQFISNSIQSGLRVETTGVQRPDVHQGKTEECAKSLGVTEPFRWRSYFP